jgi:hypothetical protein
MTWKKEETALNLNEVVRNRVLWQPKEKYTTRRQTVLPSLICTFIVVVLNIRFALNNTSAWRYLHLSSSVMGAAVEILELVV